MTSPSRRQTRGVVTGGKAGGRDWRALIFRAAAVLIALLLGALVGPLLFAPWVLVGPAPPDYTPELHRWHAADLAALAGVLVGGSLLAALPRPRRTPLLAQFALLATGILGLVALHPFDADTVMPAAVIGALVVATYPAPRALLSFAREGRVSRPLLALAIGSTVPLLLNAWTNLSLQHIDGSEHARDSHWNGSAALALSLILAGFLAASRRPGWRALGVVTGLAYLYLGVAALTIPDHDGSWGPTGGAVALLGGAAYLVLAALDRRGSCPRDAVGHSLGRPLDTPARS